MYRQYTSSDCCCDGIKFFPNNRTGVYGTCLALNLIETLEANFLVPNPIKEQPIFFGAIVAY